MLTYRFDHRAWDRLRKPLLGKTLLFKDNEEWTDADIIRGYRGQHHVETGFRRMKDTQYIFWVRLFWNDHQAADFNGFLLYRAFRENQRDFGNFPIFLFWGTSWFRYVRNLPWALNRNRLKSSKTMSSRKSRTHISSTYRAAMSSRSFSWVRQAGSYRRGSGTMFASPSG